MNSKKVKSSQEHIDTLNNIAKLPMQDTKIAGRPKREYIPDTAMTDTDLNVLSVLMASGGNKTLAARLLDVDRKKLYRLLDSKRVARIQKNAKNRLGVLVEACVLVLEHEIIENGNAEMAFQVLKGLKILSKKEGPATGAPSRKATMEEWIDDEGKTRKRKTLEESE